jgi:hypothetical protein
MNQALAQLTVLNFKLLLTLTEAFGGLCEQVVALAPNDPTALKRLHSIEQNQALIQQAQALVSLLEKNLKQP